MTAETLRRATPDVKHVEDATLVVDIIYSMPTKAGPDPQSAADAIRRGPFYPYNCPRRATWDRLIRHA
jgi:hypothetical protein